ncbi:hypothetical protein [Streptomyces sp. NBC_00198]|uniref:hypothetical protein n=1 Tax=Streptomyces sp. NBC_00198 TaxID=2975677 RepID=UPI0022570BC5|nr:hypothetical protein [Streptomyces sp. NBC_00198]MCX5284119.1 hypothetical protein [Streptomyces sp. NBC_00198]
MVRGGISLVTQRDGRDIKFEIGIIGLAILHILGLSQEFRDHTLKSPRNDHPRPNNDRAELLNPEGPEAFTRSLRPEERNPPPPSPLRDMWSRIRNHRFHCGNELGSLNSPNFRTHLTVR